MAIALVPLIHRYLLTVLYLQPPAQSWDVSSAFRSKVALAVAASLPLLIGLWRAGLWFQPWVDRSRIPWAAVIALLGVIILCVPFCSTRLTWFFVEWTIPRTPNPSFARNTLFWEQRNFESAGRAGQTLNVGLVGSSQTYQGFNLERLNGELPDSRFEKNCLAGFGPMQYPFLLERILERRFDVIVCQLSEFDFYREDVVPVSRLRWGAGGAGLGRLWSVLTPAERWLSRGDVADLWFAAHVPLWRNRDHFRRVAMDYWWKKSAPSQSGGKREVVLAETPDLLEAIESLNNNVGHKDLVEANFRSFERFARELRDHGIRLIVIEGQVHPQARLAYDHDGLQQLTRSRLVSMADAFGFQFFDQSQLPVFKADDFADAYHLNAHGSAKLTDALIDVLQPPKFQTPFSTRH